MHCALMPSVPGSIFSNMDTQIPNPNMSQFQTKAKQLSLFFCPVWPYGFILSLNLSFFLGTQVKGVKDPAL